MFESNLSRERSECAKHSQDQMSQIISGKTVYVGNAWLNKYTEALYTLRTIATSLVYVFSMLHSQDKYAKCTLNQLAKKFCAISTFNCIIIKICMRRSDNLMFKSKMYVVAFKNIQN